MTPHDFRTSILRITIFMALLLLHTQVQSQTYNYTVDDTSQSMAFTSYAPGEAQSTVVPPGLKSQCTAGRFIVTNDRKRPPDGDSVLFRDLGANTTAFSNTTFDSIPLPSGKYAFKTNDHDVITMPNEMLFRTGGINFPTTLIPKPGGFNLRSRVRSGRA